MMMVFVCFDDEEAAEGYSLFDFFVGYQFLNDGKTFDERVNSSFSSDELALDWLTKSYKGRDVDGVGVLVDGKDLPDK
jgi:hypothetical protein